MIEVLAIGGSAGSLPVIAEILEAIPARFDYSIVIILHRLKNVYSEMEKVLVNNRLDIEIKEPEDKEVIKKQQVYLAPQNYHLLVEEDKTFSLDYSELVHYSRPSIDVTFESLAHVFGPTALCVLLSGANSDGASGISKVIEKGGIGMVHDPALAEYPSMPQAAINMNKKVLIRNTKEIVTYIKAINQENEY